MRACEEGRAREVKGGEGFGRRGCEEGRAWEVEDGEGFGRRGCEAAIVGSTRGRAGRAGPGVCME